MTALRAEIAAGARPLDALMDKSWKTRPAPPPPQQNPACPLSRNSNGVKDLLPSLKDLGDADDAIQSRLLAPRWGRGRNSFSPSCQES